jgi:hypothetical protein
VDYLERTLLVTLLVTVTYKMNEDIQERASLAACDVSIYGAVVDPVGLKNIWPIVSVMRRYVGAQTFAFSVLIWVMCPFCMQSRAVDGSNVKLKWIIFHCHQLMKQSRTRAASSFKKFRTFHAT